MNIREVMLRKYGPMPVWAWTALVASFIAGVVIFRKRMAPATPGTSGTSSTTPAGEFNSGQSTTTTDANGNQVTTNYSASGPLTGIPGMITNQAGAMPYSGGDVYVNYPNQPAAPPPQQSISTVNPNQRTSLSPDFNMVGWSDKDKQSPWRMEVAQPGETWKDIAARTYSFAKDYASVSDPANKARVDQVAAYLKGKNGKYTGEVPDGTGPTPGSVVVYR